jgi:hypothetical protein
MYIHTSFHKYTHTDMYIMLQAVICGIIIYACMHFGLNIFGFLLFLCARHKPSTTHTCMHACMHKYWLCRSCKLFYRISMRTYIHMYIHVQELQVVISDIESQNDDLRYACVEVKCACMQTKIAPIFDIVHVCEASRAHVCMCLYLCVCVYMKTTCIYVCE